MWERRLIDIAGGAVDVAVSPGDPQLATLVFLHEGLGSIDLWRGFPDDVIDRCGGSPAVVFSRHGYGRSAPSAMPRPVGYMHHEADVVLPELLGVLEIERPVLIGHSDGASIGLLFAGAGKSVRSLVCIAPHVFVEPESVAGVEAARVQFDTTDMAARMARHHDDATATFLGWNDVWASDEFRSWNIEDRLAAIAVPTLLVQGANDQYGTLAQLDAIEAGVSGSTERMVVPDAGHSPHLDARDEVASAIARHVTVR